MQPAKRILGKWAGRPRMQGSVNVAAKCVALLDSRLRAAFPVLCFRR